MDISKLKKFCKNNKPEIEIVASIFGFGICVYDAIKQTRKLEAEKTEGMSRKEEVILYAKTYVRPAVIFAGSTYLAIDSHHEGLKRAIGPTTAYLVTDRAYRELDNKIKSTISPKKEEEVKAEIAKDRANAVDRTAPINTGNGDTLFFDCLSGRYFYSSINAVDAARNKYNEQLLIERSLEINYYYELLKLMTIDAGDILGCHVHFELLEVNKVPILLDDGTQCIALNYIVRPLTDVAEY